ncbi:nuclease-related domain-containing protein [Microcella sp.]|uniref:nuclease-related domain-containing protein n=1 Tax=Microcella sp. TaxID=1913979 RepID=UPI00299F814F|nr:nuclease-related domain-containing protein [Microcella sp.]MDX2026778.1 nuclease-related domain-containing protein [Microcella sp.]
MTADDVNAPGTSARREYERRKAKEKAQREAEWGRLAGFVGALTPEKQNTRAWSSGAAGEAVVGARLDGLASQSIRVMHDRRIPRSKANIDHIVVTPGGVWVIDTKRYVGKAPEKRVEGGIIRPRVDLLIVKGRDKTALVEGVRKQVGHVRDVVGEVPVFGVLCFVDADWGLFADAFTVNGVRVVWPKKLASMISTVPDAGVDVAAVAERIAQRFVRA